MDDYTLTIKVNSGDLFEGNLEQWEDCFFSFPFHYSVNDKLEQVQSYCNGHKYDLTLSWSQKKDSKEDSFIQVKFD